MQAAGRQGTRVSKKSMVLAAVQLGKRLHTAMTCSIVGKRGSYHDSLGGSPHMRRNLYTVTGRSPESCLGQVALTTTPWGRMHIGCSDETAARRSPRSCLGQVVLTTTPWDRMHIGCSDGTAARRSPRSCLGQVVLTTNPWKGIARVVALKGQWLGAHLEAVWGKWRSPRPLGSRSHTGLKKQHRG